MINRVCLPSPGTPNEKPLTRNLTVIAETNFRNQRQRFGILEDDRRKHLYVIGKTGMGKTTLLDNLAIQDIRAGKGIGIVDPHGEFAERILHFVPRDRMGDVIYFNPADLDWPIAFNVMENVNPYQRHLVASGLMSVFKKIWADSWGPRLEYVLRNAILALLEIPGSTLLGIMRILSDKLYRKAVVARVNDPMVKSFWVNEFERYPARFASEVVAPIQNKVGQFLSSPPIRNIVGQPKSSFSLREVMDAGKILVVNLSKGKLGEDNSALLGSLIVTKLQLAAMSRIDTSEDKRRDFYLYVDEFQNFATESFTNILSEARKYRLNLILANQFISQIPETIRDAVFGNVGTLITFRIGAQDAKYLEDEFEPVFYPQDLVNLPKYNIYLKLMIDGVISKPFSAATLPPLLEPLKSHRNEIAIYSRQRYSTYRMKVEREISGILNRFNAIE